MTTTDEALRVAMQSALTWMENHGEVVLDGGGWAAIDSMNKCAADLRSALRTIALAVEAPKPVELTDEERATLARGGSVFKDCYAVQSVALGEPNNGTFADKSGTFADTAGTFASASGAVGETAAGVKCAAQPHPMRPARLLSKNEVQHCTLGLGSLAAAAAVQRQFAAINGIQIAPAAGLPGTSNGQENGNG